jgi:hypothetical protein
LVLGNINGTDRPLAKKKKNPQKTKEREVCQSKIIKLETKRGILYQMPLKSRGALGIETYISIN